MLLLSFYVLTAVVEANKKLLIEELSGCQSEQQCSVESDYLNRLHGQTEEFTPQHCDRRVSLIAPSAGFRRHDLSARSDGHGVRSGDYSHKFLLGLS